MEVSVKIKKLQFKKEKIAEAVKKSNAAGLKKIGAYVMRRAQTSMRYSDTPAPEGKPPRAHRRNPMLRKLLFFAVNAEGTSVDVGPVIFKKSNMVPKLMEKGGQTTVTRHGVRRVVNIKPHPFMGPALEAEAPAFPSYWEGSVHE
ncbi:MAG TPA: hypothetical protein VHY37_03510 [Tepidisphaeraceae bacterium]|jgi:hypothetical protein|nr:hypothetical protein [Tepidisphaeraceae bacterium]